MSAIHDTAGNHNWNDTAAWQGGVVPVSTDDALIDAGSSIVTVTDSESINNITIGSTDELAANNYGTLNVYGSSIDNAGTLLLGSASDGGSLAIQSNSVTLTGGGKVVLSENSNNFISGASANDKLTNVNNIITGAGAFTGLSLDNQAGGTIDATGTRDLVIDSGTVTNEGLIEATGAGGLEIFLGQTLTNTGTIEALTNSFVDMLDTDVVNSKGTIEAVGAGAFVKLDGGLTIDGGTLAAATGGTIQVGGINTVDGAAINIDASSTLQIGNTAQLTLGSNVNNAGTFSIAATNNYTKLVIDSNGATFSGGGKVVLSDNTYNNISGLSASDKLTNVDNTIMGAGTLDVALDNQLHGTIDANGANLLIIEDNGGLLTNEGVIETTGTGGLVIGYSTVTNTGKIEALATATLQFNTDSINNAKGLIEALGLGSTIQLAGDTIKGGKVNIVAGASVESTSGASASSTLNGVTVTDKGTLRAVNGTTLNLLNTKVNATGGVVESDAASTILLDNAIINGGTLTTVSDGVIATVAGTGDTLNGSKIGAGSIVRVVDTSTLTLKGSVSNAGMLALGSTSVVTDIVSTVAGTKLTDTATGTISGAGQVGTGNLDLTLTNNGTIDANGSVALVIDTGNVVVNTGVLEADAGSGGLTIDDGVKNTAAAGTNGLFANGANVTVVGVVTGGGAATIGGATLEFQAAANEKVSFNAATNGTLKLDLAQSFVGTVAGLGSTDQIDLADFAFSGGPTVSKVTGTGAAGTTTNVTVTDGALSATLHLINAIAGEFPVSASAYTLKSDGASGTPGTLFELSPGH